VLLSGAWDVIDEVVPTRAAGGSLGTASRWHAWVCQRGAPKAAVEASQSRAGSAIVTCGEGVEGGQVGALHDREERLEALVGRGAIAGAVPLIAEAWWLKEAFRAICSRSNG
jgi:hypothetical protein